MSTPPVGAFHPLVFPTSDEPCAAPSEQEVDLSGDVGSNVFSSGLGTFLRQHGWGEADLGKLESMQGSDAFQTALCEQAVSYRSRDVLELVRHQVRSFEEGFELVCATYRALLAIIPPEGQPELESAPAGIGDIPFLSPAEREVNRRAYFSNDQFLRAPLEQWLMQQEGWTQKDVQRLPKIALFREDYFWHLTLLSIEVGSYRVLQSLPRERSSSIRKEICNLLQSTEASLAFLKGENVEMAGDDWSKV